MDFKFKSATEKRFFMVRESKLDLGENNQGLRLVWKGEIDFLRGRLICRITGEKKERGKNEGIFAEKCVTGNLNPRFLI